jgi:hypothetical protein
MDLRLQWELRESDIAVALQASSLSVEGNLGAMTLLYANSNVRVQPHHDTSTDNTTTASTTTVEPNNFTRILEIDENKMVQFSLIYTFGEQATPLHRTQPSTSTTTTTTTKTTSQHYPFSTSKNASVEQQECEQPFDAMLHVEMSSMRFLFVQRFWQDIKAYFNWFQGMNHVVNAQAARVAQAAKKKRYAYLWNKCTNTRKLIKVSDWLAGCLFVCARAQSRVGFDIVLLHPMLVYPQNATSTDCIVAGMHMTNQGAWYKVEIDQYLTCYIGACGVVQIWAISSLAKLCLQMQQATSPIGLQLRLWT